MRRVNNSNSELFFPIYIFIIFIVCLAFFCIGALSNKNRFDRDLYEEMSRKQSVRNAQKILAAAQKQYTEADGNLRNLKSNLYK